jgi:hypothetical protein
VRHRIPALVVALVALAGAGQARALTATEIRIGDHPAFVRVVVEFEDGTLRLNRVFASDPRPFADGRARIRIEGPGIDTTAAPKHVNGVSARIAQGTNRVVLTTVGAAERFKYVAYFILRGPQRLVVDLWKARPPVAGAAFTRAPQGGCLHLDSWSVGAGSATAAGREQGLFEHMFQVGLRNSAGRVVREVGVTSSGGLWSRTFSYSVAGQQAGTLEAVDFSENDGSLTCIVQVRVTLRPPPP